MNDTDLTLSLESNERYPLYYRRRGIRMPMQLVMPPMTPITELTLPMSSVLHYIPEDESLYGIPQDDPIIRDTERLIMVEHIAALADTKGSPIPLKLPPGQMTRAYHRKFRKTRPLVNFTAAESNPKTVIVENYALLPHLYRYLNNYFKPYNKWWNIQATLWDRIGKIGTTSQRQQYLQVRLPKILPTINQLRKAEEQETRATLAPFRSPESLFLLELWKWLGVHRERSVLSKCPDAAIANMNIILQDEGVYTIFNLGLFNRWRKTDENKEGALDTVAFQKRLLRLMMVFLDARQAPVEDTPIVEPAAVVVAQTPKGTEVVATGSAPDAAETVPETTAESPIVAAPERPKDDRIIVKVPTESGSTKRVEVFRGTNGETLPDDESELNVDVDRLNAQIDRDLEHLDQVALQYEQAIAAGRQSEQNQMTDTQSELSPKIHYQEAPPTLEVGVMSRVNEMAESGLLSAGEYRRFTAISEQYKKLPNPYDSQETLFEASKVNPKDLVLKGPGVDHTTKIPDRPTVIDKSMLGDPIRDFDTKYVEKVLKKDMVGMVLNLQHSGVAITDYNVDVTSKSDVINDIEEHSIQITPVQGRPSTVKFMVPKVDSEGKMNVAGVKTILRKMRIDVPIRKVSSTKVALTSYYGKVFVTRSDKQVNNYPGWLTNHVAARGMDSESNVRQLMLSNVFDPTTHVPYVYSTMAKRFRSFQIDSYTFFFDYHARAAQYGAERVASEERGGMIVCGQVGSNLIVMDDAGNLYESDQKTSDVKAIGTFESLLELSGKRPLEMIELKVFSKLIPLGPLMAYRLGFTQLLRVLQARYRIVPMGERVSLDANEFPIRFEDMTYVIDRDNRTAAMVLAGFVNFDGFTRNYSAHQFDQREIYLNLLESENLGIRYLRELDLMNDLFIDPITREILVEMQEPQTFMGLLFRVSELLQTDWSPDETDMAYMRIAGYERIPGMVYTELVKSVRGLKARGGSPNAKLELHPFAVWQGITQDASVKIVEDSSPINNVKEKEEVTYSGEGGRSDRSMVGRTRKFHQNDLGVISEATKDSSQVAVTTYLTANPNLKSLRGTASAYDPATTKGASVLSSSVMLVPGADRDDVRRQGFISIQNSSSMFSKGYRVPPLRTGYEQVLAHRTDDLFATTAKQPGKVTAVNERAITVTYDDGSTQSIELGRRYGTVASMTLPHELTTRLKVGQTFRHGDVIAYNTRYFDPDPLNPSAANFKFGCLLNVALMESPDTLEDSSAISEHAAELLGTETCEVRNLVVSFNDTIHGLVDAGDQVDVEDILCTIEDAVTAQSQLFDETSLDTLRLLAANNPKAKVIGTVERVEMFYNGEIDDLSPSLLEIAQASDRNRKRRARDLNRPYLSGRVNGSMNVDGKSLQPGQAVIRIHINSSYGTVAGSKIVMAAQLKSVVGRVMVGENRTVESNEPIDAIFGYLSISDRIVRSPEVMGTTNKLMDLITKRAIAAYRQGSS